VCAALEGWNDAEGQSMRGIWKVGRIRRLIDKMAPWPGGVSYLWMVRGGALTVMDVGLAVNKLVLWQSVCGSLALP